MSHSDPHENIPDVKCEPPPWVILTGKHVRLLPMHHEHIKQMYDSLGGQENDVIWEQHIAGPFHDVESLAQAFEPAFADKELRPYCVQLIETDAIEGFCGFVAISVANRTLEVGVVNSLRLQRTTAATEAFYLVACHAFAHGFRRLEWRCGTHNIASQRAAIRFGLTKEGTLRQHLLVKGKNRDTIILSILDHEWPRMKSAMEAWLDESNFDETGQQRKTLSGFVQ